MYLIFKKFKKLQEKYNLLKNLRETEPERMIKELRQHTDEKIKGGCIFYILFLHHPF